MFPLFFEKRDAIYQLTRSVPGLDPGRIQDTIAYLDEFYDIISDPERVEREMVSSCRESL